MSIRNTKSEPYHPHAIDARLRDSAFDILPYILAVRTNIQLLVALEVSFNFRENAGGEQYVYGTFQRPQPICLLDRKFPKRFSKLVLVHFLHDIKSTNKLAFHDQLREGRPIIQLLHSYDNIDQINVIVRNAKEKTHLALHFHPSIYRKS